MELVLLSTGGAEITERILGLIRHSRPSRQIPLFASLDEFRAWIGRPLTRPRAVVAHLAAGADLKELIGLSELLQRALLVLVLPDRERETVAAALKLGPRFYTFADANLEEIGLVLSHLLGDPREGSPLPASAAPDREPARPPAEAGPPSPPPPPARPAQPAPGRGGKYLTFSLAQTEYGISILKVKEIIGMTKITLLPRAPAEVRGVLNLRGRVIPVYDLRRCFGLPEAADTDRTCIIVTQSESPRGKVSRGIVVDSVSEVRSIRDHEVEEPPVLGSNLGGGSIFGLAKTGEGLTTLLDVDRVLGSVGTWPSP